MLAWSAYYSHLANLKIPEEIFLMNEKNEIEFD